MDGSIELTRQGWFDLCTEEHCAGLPNEDRLESLRYADLVS